MGSALGCLVCGEEDMLTVSSMHSGSISWSVSEGPLVVPGIVKETDRIVLRKGKKSKKVFLNEYFVIKRLGSGSFAKVKLVQHQISKQLFVSFVLFSHSQALKVMSKMQLKKKKVFSQGKMTNVLAGVMHSISIHKRLRHRSIIQLHEVIDDKESDWLVLVLDFAENGVSRPGEEKTEPISESTAKSYFIDIVDGLEYFQRERILHRDIKPENLMVTKEGRIKIGDFGAAISFDDKEMLRQSAGTAAFMAPELCSDLFVDFPLNAIDVWSAGVTLWVYLFGRCPFIGDSIPSTYDAILNQPLEFPHPVNAELTDILKRLLDKNPNHRITVDELKRHAWFS